MPETSVTVVNLAWHGSEVVTLTYRAADGSVAEKLLFRDDEPRLALVAEGRPWSFDGDGEAFRLASEAKRISAAPGARHLEAPVMPPPAGASGRHPVEG